MVMRIAPLIQQGVISIDTWEIDAEFGTYPQGARAKEAFFAPTSFQETEILPNHRYLFKRSKRSYPDQFWGEVVAYRIGCLLGLEVPPAFAAFHEGNGICGALIEWFYQDGKETLIHAGDMLQSVVQPDLDRKQGRKHNLKDNIRLMRAMSQQGILKMDWRKWWIDALLFDTLIGNTDRHQDNWGFLFSRGRQAQSCRLTPLFDNGTSLGHERFPERVADWSLERMEQYLSAGTHHVHRSLDDTHDNRQHIDLLACMLAEWPETKNDANQRISNLGVDDVCKSIEDLPYLALPVRFSAERMDFVIKLLEIRLRNLKVLLA